MIGSTNIKGSGGLIISSADVTAYKSDVLKGTKTVTKDSEDRIIEGELELTGNIIASDILVGKTGYSTNPKTKITGTNPNRGAWTSTVGMNGKTIIPEGSHSGGGFITGPTVTQRGAWNSSVAMNGKTTVPEGYHNGSGSISGPAVTQRGAWNGSVAMNAKILIPEGYHNGSGGINGPSISTLAGSTITPSGVQQTVSCANKYMTSNIIINKVTPPTADKMIAGYSYMGITGSAKIHKYTKGNVTSSTSAEIDVCYSVRFSLGFTPIVVFVMSYVNPNRDITIYAPDNGNGKSYHVINFNQQRMFGLNSWGDNNGMYGIVIGPNMVLPVAYRGTSYSYWAAGY